ncbi:Y184 [Hepatospora eriocheir]|uniref:Y184 n=1 Tax=Hepatospora eriocheir TaxID=1081669 RepID=A0A1X0QK47_9MICR|nr:Y184 [Hepatospora eriocheir]ORE00161.1 Y184 [Hepatospora eriocheir]
MRTIDFKPNEENIKLRRNIVPFNTNDTKMNIEPISFKLYSVEKEIIHKSNEKFDVDQRYIETSFDLKNAYHVIKVTNIPISVDRPRFEGIVTDNCKGIKYISSNIAFDKTTNKSRGIGFIECSTSDDAKEIAKELRKVVIDSMKLNAEILKK